MIPASSAFTLNAEQPSSHVVLYTLLITTLNQKAIALMLTFLTWPVESKEIIAVTALMLSHWDDTQLVSQGRVVFHPYPHPSSSVVMES